MTNSDLQNTTQKTKDQATRTPVITEGELECSINGTHHTKLIFTYQV